MKPLEYLETKQTQSLEHLKDFLRIPSISANSENKPDMRKCAEFLSAYLHDLDIKTRIIETKGHPIVFSEHMVDPSLPTVLIYGHYDVQPPDPLELWKSSPFEPLEENGYLIARGATDDKGQVFLHLKSLEAYIKTDHSIPVNIKLLIEGEEEIASPNLVHFIENNKEQLACDIAVISDGSQLGINLPTINYGLRGVVALEAKITGPAKDLHSGSYGGSIANPIHVLCKLISKFHDDQGHILVDGFYDDVYIPDSEEKKRISQIPFSREDHLLAAGVKKLWGEQGFSTLERIWIRPTLECNGITGGYQGEGGKTIIPSWASVKITARLVPNMNPQDIGQKIKNYLIKNCPDNAEISVIGSEGGKPIHLPIKSPWITAASNAIQQIYGKKPFLTKEGGSIPVVEALKTYLGVDTLLIGFGQHDDNTHSPNERFLIKDFHRGAQTSVILLKELAAVRAKL